MNKKQLAENVIKAVKESGKLYQVLDGDLDKPKHIRIDGWGDIWPSTSTFRHGNKWYRKDYKKLCQMLSVEPAKTPKSETQKRMELLEENYCYLEDRVQQLEAMLNI